MAYSLSNKSARNLCKRAVLGQLIIENVVRVFRNTVYYTTQVLHTYVADVTVKP